MMFIYNCYTFSNVFESSLPRVMPQKNYLSSDHALLLFRWNIPRPFIMLFPFQIRSQKLPFHKHIIEKHYIRTYPTDSSCTFPSPAPRNHPSKWCDCRTNREAWEFHLCLSLYCTILMISLSFSRRTRWILSRMNTLSNTPFRVRWSSERGDRQQRNDPDKSASSVQRLFPVRTIIGQKAKKGVKLSRLAFPWKFSVNVS